MVLEVATIGLGELGHIQSQVCTELDSIELIAGVDIAKESRNRFEAKYEIPTYEDYQTMLAEHGDELDAVNIITPHTFHFDQAITCLEAGVHVHLEKPMVTNTSDAIKLIEYTDEQELVLQIGYQRHFHPAYREIKRLIDEDRIGDVHMVACYLAQDWIAHQSNTWRTNPDLSDGGQLIDSGSHLLDILLWTTDTEPRSVAATVDNWDQKVDVNSALSAVLERNGRQITASIGISGDGEAVEEHISIWGTKGRIAYEDSTLTVVENGTRYTSEFKEPDYTELTEDKLKAFVDAIQSDGPSPVPGEFGLRVTRLTEAAFLASETGKAVDAASLPRTETQSTDHVTSKSDH